jgi:hypothetical protein
MPTFTLTNKRKRSAAAQWNRLPRDSDFFRRKYEDLQGAESQSVEAVRKETFIDIIHFHNSQSHRTVQNYQNLSKLDLWRSIQSLIQKSYRAFKEMVVRQVCVFNQNVTNVMVGDTAAILHHNYCVGEAHVKVIRNSSVWIQVNRIYPLTEVLDHQLLVDHELWMDIQQLSRITNTVSIVNADALTRQHHQEQQQDQDQQCQQEYEQHPSVDPPNHQQERQQQGQQEQQSSNQELRHEIQRLKQQVKELKEKNKNIISLFAKAQSTVYSSYSQALECLHEEDEQHGQSVYIEGQVVTFTQNEWDLMKGSNILKFVLTKILEKHPTLSYQTHPANIRKKTKDDICDVIKKHFFNKRKSDIKNAWRGLVFKQKK